MAIETVPDGSFFARAAGKLCGQDYLSVYEDVSMGTRILRADVTFHLGMKEPQRRKTF
jgi:hypothetical protein